MKAHFNQLLEHQKAKVHSLETQVSSSKLTYADALRNLEQISDEIHQTRRKASLMESNTLSVNKQRSLDSNASFLDDAQELIEVYKSLPQKMTDLSSPVPTNLEEIEGYKNVSFSSRASPISSESHSEKLGQPISVAQSQSSEWTEINLDTSSPEDDVPYRKLNSADCVEKPKLQKQTTLSAANEFTSLKNKMKLDTNITNWISRSSAKNEEVTSNSSKLCALNKAFI